MEEMINELEKRVEGARRRIVQLENDIKHHERGIQEQRGYIAEEEAKIALYEQAIAKLKS